MTMLLYKHTTGLERARLQVGERLPRYFVPGQPQHIIQRGNNRDVVFAHEDDYRFYLECLAEAALKHQLKIHAYVLMTNHVHLLATPETQASIPKTLQSVGRRYVQYFNRHYRRTGTLWEGRYKATIIDSERYLLTCSRYIERNPVRAAMVPLPGQYRWSSYRANALGEPNPLLSPHAVYSALGSTEARRQRAYRALFNQVLSHHELNEIRESANKGWALGDEKFRQRIETLTQRRTEPRPRGRPKKVNDEDRI